MAHRSRLDTWSTAVFASCLSKIFHSVTSQIDKVQRNFYLKLNWLNLQLKWSRLFATYSTLGRQGTKWGICLPTHVTCQLAKKILLCFGECLKQNFQRLGIEYVPTYGTRCFKCDLWYKALSTYLWHSMLQIELSYVATSYIRSLRQQGTVSNRCHFGSYTIHFSVQPINFLL